MPNQKFKPVFEMTLSEQMELIKPEVERVQLENLERGLYNSYRDERNKGSDLIVRQYKDHKELVKIDAATGSIQIIKLIR